MDDQLLRDALRTSTVGIDLDARPAPASQIRALGDQRRRRRHGVTALAVTAGAAMAGSAWLGLPSAGGPGPFGVAAGGSSSGVAGSVVDAAGLVLVVVLAALVVGRAWTSRRAAGGLLASGAVLLAVAVVAGLCTTAYAVHVQGRSLSVLVVAAVLIPHLVPLGAMVRMLGQAAGARLQATIAVATVAISGSLAYAFPNQSMRLWWGYAHANWAFRLTAVVMLAALVMLLAGWAIRGDASLRPGMSRRLTAFALLAALAVASSLPWLYNARPLFDGSPTVLATAGQVILLLIPGALVVFGPSRRAARHVIGYAVLAQLVVTLAWGVDVLSSRPSAFLVFGYPVAFVLVGALLLWTASLVALPGNARDADAEADVDA